jgi:hypothetical protein
MDCIIQFIKRESESFLNKYDIFSENRAGFN